MKATIRNDFHNTKANVYTHDGILSTHQVRRVRSALCGMPRCACGGCLSERGPQDVIIEPVGYENDNYVIKLSWPT